MSHTRLKKILTVSAIAVFTALAPTEFVYAQGRPPAQIYARTTAGAVVPVKAASDGTLATSGSGGGPATVADGADVAQGAVADAAATPGGAGTISAKLRLATDLLSQLLTQLGVGFNILNGSLTDTDDGTLAGGQSSVAAVLGLGYVWNGSNWVRPPTDNGASGTSTPRVTIASNSTGALGLNAGTNLIGSVVTFPGTLVKGAVTSAMTGTTSTSVVSGTASNYLYITQCVTSNASTTVSTDILLQDGSGGTTLYVLPAPAASVATTGGGGGAFSFPTPIKVDTSGNALFAANVTTGSSTKISCSGYRSTVSY